MAAQAPPFFGEKVLPFESRITFIVFSVNHELSHTNHESYATNNLIYDDREAKKNYVRMPKTIKRFPSKNKVREMFTVLGNNSGVNFC